MSPKLLRMLTLSRNQLRVYPGYHSRTPVEFVHAYTGCIWMRWMLSRP